MNYDVVIFSGLKEVHRLELTVESISKLNPQPENIYVVTPEPQRVSIPNIQVFSDDEVLKLERKGERKNWIWQQCAKLFQNITKNDWYFTVDSDLVFMKPLELFSKNGKPMFWRYLIAGNNRGKYFNKIALGLEDYWKHSLMTHFMMFDRKLCNELLIDFCNYQNYKGNDPLKFFYEFAVERGDNNFSEWELYGNYIATKHREKYEPELVVKQAVDGPLHFHLDLPFMRNFILLDMFKYADVITVHSRVSSDSF